MGEGVLHTQQVGRGTQEYPRSSCVLPVTAKIRGGSGQGELAFAFHGKTSNPH